MRDTLQESTDRKSALRSEILSRRDAIPLPVRKMKDVAVTERLLALPEYSSAGAVLFYASFRSEVSTNGAIAHALSEGKTVLLPRVNEEEVSLEIYQIRSVEELTPGYMGIPEPTASDTTRGQLSSRLNKIKNNF